MNTYIVYFGGRCKCQEKKNIEQKDGPIVMMVANNVTALNATGWHT